jgi:FKBP-type peptidyl-prolyl cis-trans isomerase FkpA
MITGSCATITGVDPGSSQSQNRIDDLVIKDIKTGHGNEAIKGSRVQVHYTGWLYDTLAKNNKGTKFDSSHDRGRPFSFTLGKREVIAGWEQGVQGMKAGGKRQLIIPARLAYGRRGAGRLIPPGATLLFDVELLDVK